MKFIPTCLPCMLATWQLRDELRAQTLLNPILIMSTIPNLKPWDQALATTATAPCYTAYLPTLRRCDARTSHASVMQMYMRWSWHFCRVWKSAYRLGMCFLHGKKKRTLRRPSIRTPSGHSLISHYNVDWNASKKRVISSLKHLVLHEAVFFFFSKGSVPSLTQGESVHPFPPIDTNACMDHALAALVVRRVWILARQTTLQPRARQHPTWCYAYSENPNFTSQPKRKKKKDETTVTSAHVKSI